VEKLGIDCETLGITKPYDLLKQLLEPHFKGGEFGITEENIQSRIRGLILMAFANKQGYVLINTTNKSELAVGYGTLYGDMNGGLSVLGDLYKTQVYRLAAYINRDEEVIPHNIIEKAPSAELKPGQKDTDSLPPYEILDDILYELIDCQHSAREIIAKGYDPGLVEKVTSLVNSNEFKRYQAPPVLRISDKAFGLGRRMPIVAKY
jgi:NAD+ synthase (glutamine-hydrolysing)